MDDQVASTDSNADENAPPTTLDKGKGKAVDPVPDVSMDEDDDSSEGEESGPEDQVVEEGEGEDEDNLEEIDMDNIIADGRRTRGKAIDFAKAAAEDDEDDEDEEDDEDFEDSDDEMKDY